MDKMNIAILGCGTVGGGVARILIDLKKDLDERSQKSINLVKIVDMFPKASSEKHKIPLSLFAGNGNDLSKDDANKYIKEILDDSSIDLVIETIGGSSEYILNLHTSILNSKKHLVTANKALLSKYKEIIFETARKNNKSIGFEAAVCGAIPIIKVVKECFTGDEIISIAGIMNGTSNYILSKMQEENMSFDKALKLAQEKGYAEADPTLDINGHDAAHKLTILIKLAFGADIKVENMTIKGIQDISDEDLSFAKEMDCTIKLICYAHKKDGTVYATVQPMMVRNENFLTDINGATNAVLFHNRYSEEHILVGKGAGSLETGSAIVSDIVFIARYADRMSNELINSHIQVESMDDLPFSYNIIFDTKDFPGITGYITTAIGKQQINIDTLGHNRREKENALFAIATMPCTLTQIKEVINEIKSNRKEILISEPKVIPILD